MKLATGMSLDRAARRRRSGDASLNQRIEVQKGREPALVAAGRSGPVLRDQAPPHAEDHAGAGCSRTRWGLPRTMVARSGGGQH
ncbi:hypothetical protein V6N13_038052 [Hibiscus sabdariffa]